MIHEEPNESVLPIVKMKMIATNCNTLLRGADYSDDYSCLAYASDNLIHIYDPKKMKTYLTLKKHKQRVNGVKWLQSKKFIVI
jgi:hypothetical protein